MVRSLGAGEFGHSSVADIWAQIVALLKCSINIMIYVRIIMLSLKRRREEKCPMSVLPFSFEILNVYKSTLLNSNFSSNFQSTVYWLVSVYPA